MHDNLSINDLITLLRSQNIKTWFDLGLFLDKIKENRISGSTDPFFSVSDGYRQFENKGIAFITFHYSIDGVSVEVQKYAELIKRDIPSSDIHYISGIFKTEAEKLIPDFIIRKEIPEIQGFDDWKLYEKFYFTQFERGSAEYNTLIIEFWEETLGIIKKLGDYILKNNIGLFYLVNVASNPGNVSLTLASVLLSEYYGIPVVNNNHDFYWEGGSRAGFINQKKNKKGPRDFFFANAHLGEFFSIIELLFPWESKRWIHVNINRSQSEFLIKRRGINPANVMEIGTAVDTSIYFNIDKRKKINAFLQLEKILSRYKNQLIVYSVEDVINTNLVNQENAMPILIGNKTRPVNKFVAENIIFLQPTRIISRKRIEVGFRLLIKILENKGFNERLKKTKNLKITILVTGPIASGHYLYFTKLMRRFRRLLENTEEKIRDKIYLAFLFSELDKESFKSRFKSPVGIPELYNIASLVLLPSKTEGRGLPIIESTACGTPIFVRKYAPRNVYEEVIGYHLEEKNRLKVIEYDGKNIKKKYANAIIERVLFPHKYTEEVNHNRKAVVRRFSLEALNNNLQEILYRLVFQLNAGEHEKEIVIRSLDRYRKSFKPDDPDLKSIMNTDNRQYLAGYGKLSFMIYLKSLIDPSFFRIEQMEFKGRIFQFALEIMKKDPEEMHIPIAKKLKFLNTIEEMFNYREGKLAIRHDHSMSYRHRNMNYYPYQDYTMQELTGLVNIFYFAIIEPTIITQVKETPHFFTDWNLALLQLTGSTYLSIDNRKELIKKLKKNIPIAYFPGEHLMHELELFILQPVRSRLDMGIEEVLTEKILTDKAGNLAKIYVFTQEKNLGNQLNREETAEYILTGKNEELKLLYNFGIIELVPTRQWTVGIHFAQLGSRALKVLSHIKKKKGFLITNRRNAILMTDIIDLDRFHIGKARTKLDANMLGIPGDSGYIQYSPAGIRTVLSYPVPVQTAKDFDRIFRSKLFKTVKEKIGEKKLFEQLKKDAEMNGSPLQFVLENKLKMLSGEKENKAVNYQFISGIYEDGHPYNGVIANINIHHRKWEFLVASVKDRPAKVTSFVMKYEKELKNNIPIAWNGGYILNPELVGKLGIKESFIGSPLGLIISDGKMLSPPLFNKAALLIYNDGHLDIKRVSVNDGLSLKIHNRTFTPGKNKYNLQIPTGDVCFYDLLYNEEFILNNRRIAVILAGNVVKDIIKGSEISKVEMIPVGLTLSFSEESFPEKLKVGDEIEIIKNEFKEIKHAVEAGPMLLDGGNKCIDMHREGWKHPNSIRTQAARLDYTDMRGPKIAAGIDNKGNLTVLAVNGRIRESVGATHDNMAEILKEKGIIKAMGFDPGGSSTLVVDGEARNISPYNQNYEQNIYSQPPEPRAVSNTIMGYLKEE